MSNADLISEIAQILEPWAWETKSYNATCARDDATSKAEQIAQLFAATTARPTERGTTALVYCVMADSHSETTGDQWFVGAFPTAEDASAAAIAERAAKPDCETTIYLGSMATTDAARPTEREAVERISRAIDPGAWVDELPGMMRATVESFHLRRQQANAAAQRVAALTPPVTVAATDQASSFAIQQAYRVGFNDGKDDDFNPDACEARMGIAPTAATDQAGEVEAARWRMVLNLSTQPMNTRGEWSTALSLVAATARKALDTQPATGRTMGGEGIHLWQVRGPNRLLMWETNKTSGQFSDPTVALRAALQNGGG